MILSTLAVAVLGSAPMADVWPFKSRRLADGSIEYVYDLTALKASSGFGDAKEANGDYVVKKFLAGLPKQVTVKLPPHAGVTLTGGQGLELAPMTNSFALTPDGPLATDNPLGKKTGARLLAPLDPRTPKVLVGAELPLWLARQLEGLRARSGRGRHRVDAPRSLDEGGRARHRPGEVERGRHEGRRLRAGDAGAGRGELW